MTQMRISNQGKLIGLSIIVFLAVLSFSWWWLYSSDVETVLSVDEVRGDWSLSPDRDKVIFRSGGSYVLMSLTNKQRHVFGGNKCDGHYWLDNKILRCENIIIDTRDFTETSYSVIDASQVNWKTMLANVETIYANNSSNFIFVLAHNYQNNPDKNFLVKGVKNIDEVLKGYTYVPVPLPDPNVHSDGKAYSPNGTYYFVRESIPEGAVLTIYNAADDQKLSQTPGTRIQEYLIGGWAADSSGVYYQLYSIGFLGKLHPLQKLKVP